MQSAFSQTAMGNNLVSKEEAVVASLFSTGFFFSSSLQLMQLERKLV